MMDKVMELSIFQLVCSYIIVVMLLILFRSRGIKREREIIIASARMTIQLTVMGYVLVYVFKNPNPFVTVIMITIMVTFAIYNSLKRIKGQVSKQLKEVVVWSISIGFLIISVFFIVAIVNVKPWFNPQYVIPICGMIIGNSMTGITLGANTLCNDMMEKREQIENSLMLGATWKVAVHDIVNNAFDSAILPTMNNMLTMGIVSLPGMMTGQILSGTFPLTAIKYQIGIMLAILGSTALSVFLFVTWGSKTFFTKDSRMK